MKRGGIMKFPKPTMDPKTVHALKCACWRLGIETRLTADDREEIYQVGLRVPTKSQVKRSKQSWKALVDHGQSMMHMHPRPTGQKPVVALPQRTKTLLAAHNRRQEAGWLHG